jgi:hypothetical protein
MGRRAESYAVIDDHCSDCEGAVAAPSWVTVDWCLSTGTLGGAAGIAVLLCGVIFEEKISDRCSSALSVLVSMGANGSAGWGCFSASVSWMAAFMAVSLEDRVGIL